jgi:hypothetical protein
MNSDSTASSPAVDVISSVSLALRDLIVRGIGNEFGLTSSDVRFSSPGDDPPASSTGLSLFSYRLQAAKALSNMPARLSDPASSPSATLQVERVYPPLPLELCYMLVPHSEDALIGLQLVGSLARLFYSLGVVDVAALPESRARRDLLASGNLRLKLVAQYPDMEAIQSIWSAIRAEDAFKLALYYLVTPVMLPAQRVESLYRVRELIAETHASIR